MFSCALELTLHRTLAYANQRSHKHATLEHLLLALTDDGDACAMMNACKIDVAALKVHLTSYIGNELKAPVTNDGRDSRPTAAFRRVVQSAVLHVQGLNGDTVTGADVGGLSASVLPMLDWRVAQSCCWQQSLGLSSQAKSKSDATLSQMACLGGGVLRWGGQMQSPRELRERAARFLALVSIVRQKGDIGLADMLTEWSARLLEEADAAAAGQIIPPPLPETAHPNPQQQQHIQPKDDNK